MKALIYIIIINIYGFCAANAQTYISGYKVIPLSQVSNDSLLTPSQRLTHTTAFEKLKTVNDTPLQTDVSDMIGEYWWIDNMLINTVTRQLSEEFPKENLKDIQRSLAPSLMYAMGTTPNTQIYDDWFSEIKSVNNFDVLIHYLKTKSDTKHFFIQDKAGHYYVLGTIYVKKSDAQKAHQLIDTILNGITFKE